jgi:uncharacterized protein (TIGR02452 family)
MTTSSHRISRELAREHGEEAVKITQSGQYRSPSGRIITIKDLVGHSLRETKSYPPAAPFDQDDKGKHQTAIEITNETTLSAAQRLLKAGHHPVVLNFASATSPGGGFLSGARAQEEYLCRSSSLYSCLRDNPMYDFHRSNHDPLYSNYAIYSPGVTIFRSNSGGLLEEPYAVGVITSPAVNAKRLPLSRRHEIAPAMWQRILKVLSIGVVHGHDVIVLGAWGCGAFGNDGYEIAGLFRKALDDNFKGAYRTVVFAIVDWSSGKKYIGPFEEVFEIASH